MSGEPRLLDLDNPTGAISYRVIEIKAIDFARWRIECLRERNPERAEWHEKHFDEFVKTITEVLQLHYTFTDDARMGGVFMEI